MTDHDALVRAVCEFPDDDTPRLVYADFLEEHGEPDRAAFVRAQVELARTPAWEPFAVLCRHRKAEWSEEGRPFRHTLPAIPDGLGAGWPARPFRRGLGWRLEVGSLIDWDRLAPPLFEQAPIGEIVLNAKATLDDLRRLAACGSVLRQLRVVHLTGGSPVEAVRVLCDAPDAVGLTDLYFHRASGAGMPELVEDLLQTPLGRGLKGLHFRVGYESLDLLIRAIAGDGGAPRLERLSFATMGLHAGDTIGRLLGGPAARQLAEVDLRDNPLDAAGVLHLLHHLPPAVHTLGLAGLVTAGPVLESFAREGGRFAAVRKLDLSRNVMTPRAAGQLKRNESLAGLRSLAVRNCRVGERQLAHLTRARFWPNLVELDLRDNPIDDGGARHLLNAPIPPDLTVLLLTTGGLSGDTRTALREHFGERLILEEAAPG